MRLRTILAKDRLWNRSYLLDNGIAPGDSLKDFRHKLPEGIHADLVSRTKALWFADLTGDQPGNIWSECRRLNRRHGPRTISKSWLSHFFRDDLYIPLTTAR